MVLANLPVGFSGSLVHSFLSDLGMITEMRV